MKRFDDAERYYKSALDLLRANGNSRAEAMTHANLASVTVDRMQYKDAVESLRQAEAIFGRLGDRSSLRGFGITSLQ
jgi:tetratricopeptide (TPR) repeat protein